MGEGQLVFSSERRDFRALTLAAIAAGALAIESCGGKSTSGSISTEKQTSNQSHTSINNNSTRSQTSINNNPELVFDDLGGDSSVIKVYPGPKDMAKDRVFNGTYNDGDSVGTECKTEGRTVHSDTATGEQDRSSNEWIKIQGSPGETQYATAVYVENPEKLLSELEPC
jgi:hypothetical protein